MALAVLMRDVLVLVGRQVQTHVSVCAFVTMGAFCSQRAGQ